MKKIYLRVIVAAIMMAILPLSVYGQVDNDAIHGVATDDISGWPKGPDIFSETGVLMETTTAEVLYDKGMNEKRYPASITKVMTALLALDNSAPDEQVTFTATALEGMEQGTNIGMQVGEVLTMEQCLQILLMKSANEVANQIAEHVGGSQEEFANMMNEKAVELGCQNTHFTNASGMPDENHYTTAYDMALIFREALKNEEFCKLISELSYTLEPTNMNPEARSFSNAHAVFVPNVPEHYEGCIGGKTGVTQAAKNTLVTAAQKDGTELIAVVLRADSHGEVCIDTRVLFDYGYDNFDKINSEEGNLVAPKGATAEELVATEEISGENDTKTIKTYTFNDYLLGSMEVTSDGPKEDETEEPEKVPKQHDKEDDEAIEHDNEGAKDKPLAKPNYRTVITVLGALIIVGIVLMVLGVIRKRKSR